MADRALKVRKFEALCKECVSQAKFDFCNIVPTPIASNLLIQKRIKTDTNSPRTGDRGCSILSFVGV